ncbi:helix-turn-helix domain-containing protein [Streptomyces zhihengii]|uniref:helix-turn-helix domain-containing protein n=1 Tax=Streptomyces zhihengii TaxID=1818004 RepID=UPI0033ACF0F9
MDTEQISAPSRSQYRVRRRVTAFGVIHVNAIHTNRFTIVGNHLAQHGALSLTAIGLAVHIQSLPDGAKVGIKVLADRFPESEARIAAALRELEAHSYLARTVERLPGGRVVTRTVLYNHPDAAAGSVPPAPEPPAEPERTPVPAEPPADAPEPPREAAPPPQPAPPPVPQRAPEPELERAPEREAEPEREPAPAPLRPPLPQPLAPAPEIHRTAADLLAGLRRDDPRLILGETDVRRLAPAVAAWLERGITPEAARHTLTGGLPHPLRRPAALLAHRLTVHLPPRLPDLPPPEVVHPMHDCTGTCERVIRAAEPGPCRDCRLAAEATRAEAA